MKGAVVFLRLYFNVLAWFGVVSLVSATPPVGPWVGMSVVLVFVTVGASIFNIVQLVGEIGE